MNNNEKKYRKKPVMIILTEAIEIIPCTEKAKEIILGVKDYEC